MTYVCPVCGWPGLKEPAYDEFGYSSFEICPSCWTEFGNDDFATDFATLRQRWVDGGMPWGRKRTGPPDGWDPIAQLAAAGFAD